MGQIERMSTSNFSDVNWRAPMEQNWRTPGPKMPRYFFPRYSNSKTMNNEFPTFTCFVNKMIALPRLSAGICNIQDLKKIATDRIDFYPDFAGITKIVQDTLSSSKDTYNSSGNIFTLLSPTKIDNICKSQKSENDLSESMKKKEDLSMPVTNDNSTNLDKDKKKLIKNVSKSKSMAKQNSESNQSESIAKTNREEHRKKSRHCKNKKSKKSKKHKEKSNTMHDILEDYYQDLEDTIDENILNKTTTLSPKSSPLDYISNNSCAYKLSQSFEKCWNYLQNLPPVKHINDAMSISKSPTENLNNDFVYIHNLDDGQLATESVDMKPKTVNARKRLSSDCETEDSFVVFADENHVPERFGSIRKPSLCDSNDSFVICFGESSQSPEECFMFDDIFDRDSYQGNSSSYEDESDCDNVTSDSDSTFSSIRSATENAKKICQNTSTSRKTRSDKKVSFDPKGPIVHHIIAWSYAYQQARKGEWEQYGRDRVRFEQRVEKTKSVLEPVLAPEFRQKIFQERFQNFIVNTDELDGKNNNSLKNNLDHLNKCEENDPTANIDPKLRMNESNETHSRKKIIDFKKPLSENSKLDENMTHVSRQEATTDNLKQSRKTNETQINKSSGQLMKITAY